MSAYREAVGRFVISRRASIQAAIDGGRALIALRATVQFGDWSRLIVESGQSVRSARRWVRLAQLGLSSQQVLDRGGIRAVTDAKSATVADLETEPNRADEDALLDLAEKEGSLSNAVEDEEAEPSPTTRTPTERITAERDGLALAVDELRAEVEDSQQKLRFYEGERSAHEVQREVVFNQLRAQVSSLRASRDEWQQRANDALRDARYWKRRALTAEGKWERATA